MADKFKDWNFTQPDKEQNYSGKGGTAWKFKKSAANNLYNEGDRITNSHDPVWDLRTGGRPITKKHSPCGYWTNETLYVYWVFTSLTYPIESIDSIHVITQVRSGTLRVLFKEYTMKDEALEPPIMTPMSGTLRQLLLGYTMEDEALEPPIMTPMSGTLRQLLLGYTMEDEALEPPIMEPRGGTIKVTLVTYSNYPAEALEPPIMTPMSGTLIIP